MRTTLANLVKLVFDARNLLQCQLGDVHRKISLEEINGTNRINISDLFLSGTSCVLRLIFSKRLRLDCSFTSVYTVVPVSVNNNLIKLTLHLVVQYVCAVV